MKKPFYTLIYAMFAALFLIIAFSAVCYASTESFSKVIYENSFEEYPCGELSRDAINTNEQYKRLYSDMAWSLRPVNCAPQIVQTQDNGKCMRIATYGVDSAADGYFRTRGTNAEFESMQSVMAKIDFSADVHTDAAITSVVRNDADAASKQYMDYLQFTSEGKILFSDGVQINYDVDKKYEIVIFADFKGLLYTVYINGELARGDVPMNIENAEYYPLTFGVRTDKTEANGYIYVDNIGFYSGTPAKITSIQPASGTKNMPVTGGSVKFTFDTYFNSVSKSFVNVEPAADFHIECDRDTVTVVFDSVLSFDTDYTVKLCGNLKDAAGRNVPTNSAVNFKTMQKSVFISEITFDESPQGTINARAVIINPLSDISVKAFIGAYSENGVMVASKSETINAVSGRTPVFISLDISQKDAAFVRAFITNGNELVPATNKLYQYEKDTQSVNTDNAETSLSFENKNLSFSNGNLTISGKCTNEGIRVLVLEVLAGSQSVLIVPIYTENDGSFLWTLPIEEKDEEYTVRLYAPTLAAKKSASVYYLTEQSKNNLLQELERLGAEKFIAAYGEKLNLDKNTVTTSFITVLDEKRPLQSLDEIKLLAEKVYGVEQQIRSASYDKYENIFSQNADILFGNSMQKYTEFTQKNSDEKTRITIAIANSDVSDLLKFRSAFLQAMLNRPNGNGGGNGGSGAGGSSGSMINTGSAAASTVFPDISEALWVEKAASALKKRGVLTGDENGNLRPNDSVTRAEFVKMLVTAISLEIGGTNTYTDVPANSWYAPYAAAAQRSGIVKGDENGRFSGSGLITRQDMSVMIYRWLNSSNAESYETTDINIPDIENVSDYASDAVKTLYGLQILNGMDDGRFMPHNISTRAQAVKIIYELLEKTGRLTE